jgi:hypothetical protein
MPFFARPDLSNEQFKQLTGSQLALSGQTQIVTVSGLTLTNGLGGNIPITAIGATGVTANGHVMTYDVVSNTIKLMPSSGSGGTSTYLPPYKSPSTCSVGGIPAGTILTGKTLSCILQDILVPTVNSNVVAPFISGFTISPSNIQEVGSSIVVSSTIGFNRGIINPLYQGVPPFSSVPRSGLPNTYTHSSMWLGNTAQASSSLSNTFVYPSQLVQLGNNWFSGKTAYNSGATCVYNSSCIATQPPLPASTVGSWVTNICGVYPWYWGKSLTPPTINQGLLDSYSCRCVADSSGSIVVDNYAATGEYIWFAIPNISTSKTKWQGANNVSNNGVIPGGLFPAPSICAVNSPFSSNWTSIPYKFYVSNYATSVNYGMTFSN